MLCIFFAIFLLSNPIKSQLCTEVYGRSECSNVKFTADTYLEEEKPNEALLITNSTGLVAKATLLKLTTVKQLSLSQNEFDNIDSDVLCAPPNLTSLVIFDNRKFPRITRKLLEHCGHLEKIHLDEVDIENGAFTDLTNLKSLVINGSKLAEVNPTFFTGLKSLTSLTISDSEIGKLSKDALSGVKYLIQLNLSGDKLGILPTLGYLSELEFLDLSDNNLTTLTWDEFEGLKSLQKLFLGQNPLTYVNVEKLLANLPKLNRVFVTPDTLSEENTKTLEALLPKNNITLIYA